MSKERLTPNDLTIPPKSLYIDLNHVDNIVVKINNSEIKIDKNKLETFLKVFDATE